MPRRAGLAALLLLLAWLMAPAANAAPASRPSPAPAAPGQPTLGGGSTRRANPMFYQDRPSLELRERIFMAVLSCFLALYAFFWLARQLLAPTPPPAAARQGAPRDDGPRPPPDAGAPPAEGPSPPPAPSDDDFPALRALARFGPWHAFGFYLVVAVAVTFPVILHLTSRVVGDNESDVWKHLWGYWWVRGSLLRHFLYPLASTDINAPFGGSLFCIDPLNALVAVPLQAVMPLPAAFNVIVLVQLALGAFGAYCLVAYLTESRAAALPAGLIYGFSPYVMAYPVASGVTETLNLAWVPLSLLYFLRTAREGGLRNILRLAIFVFLTIFGSFYYAAFLMLLFALLALGALLVGSFAMARAPNREGLREAARVVGRCVAGLAIAGLMGIFPVYAFFYTISRPDSIIPPYVRERENLSGEYMALITQNYASLASYVLVGKENLTSTFTVDRLSRSTYLGYLVIFWFLMGLTVRGWSRCAALLALFFLLLSLGPYMVITQSIRLRDPVSPIYVLLYSVLPLFSKIAIPYRLALMVCLFGGITAAFGMRRVLAPQPAWMQNLLGLAIALQILIEYAVASPAPYPAPLAPAAIPAFYREVAAEKAPFSILELPPTRWNTELCPGEYFLYQTVHQRPIPYTISGTAYQSMLANGFTKRLCFPHFEPPNPLPPLRRLDALAWLRSNGFKYVTVHPRMLMPDDGAKLTALLERVLGKPREVGGADDPLWVYEVPTPQVGAR